MEKVTVWVIAEDGTASVSIEEVDMTFHDGFGFGNGYGLGNGDFYGCFWGDGSGSGDGYVS